MEVRTYLGTINPQSRYFPFIRERNGNIANYIAQYAGMQYNPSPLMEIPLERTYLVPGGTLDSQTAKKLLIQTEQDFYGTSVSAMSDIGKTVLHPRIYQEHPAYSHPLFTTHVSADNLVLPGFSAYSVNEIIEAFHILQSQFAGVIRLKKTRESDGNGQFEIHSAEQLRMYLRGDNLLDCLPEEGLVVEPNIQQKKTISGGVFIIGGDEFSFVADQKDGYEGQRNVYLGAERVVVVKGNFNILLDVLKQTSDDRLEQTQKISLFHSYYLQAFQPVASRISYDFLEGTHGKKSLGGITDITGRLGGTCPALVLAALQLQRSPRQAACVAEVHLNYTPAQFQEHEQGATVFMDQKSLRISARINQVI